MPTHDVSLRHFRKTKLYTQGTRLHTLVSYVLLIVPFVRVSLIVRDTLTIPGQPWIVSHAYSVVDVEQSNWLKPVLLWTIVGMPTESGKSPLFKYLSNLLRLTRPKCGLDATKSGRLVEDARFEKWGT